MYIHIYIRVQAYKCSAGATVPAVQPQNLKSIKVWVVAETGHFIQTVQMLDNKLIPTSGSLVGVGGWAHPLKTITEPTRRL
jgi:hypothetical protein